MRELVVEVAYDGELSIWFVEQSDIPGLHVETPTFEALVEVVEDVAPDLIAGNLAGGTPASF